MTLSGVPAFAALIAPGDSVTFTDNATPSPAATAMGQGGWLSMNYGFRGGRFTSGLTDTFGIGLVTDANRGREAVIRAGVVQPGWSVVATVLGANSLRLVITRLAGWLPDQHVLEVSGIPQGSTYTGGSLSAPDGLGVQTYTRASGPAFPATLVGRTIQVVSTVPENNATPVVISASATQLTFSNPGGSAQVFTTSPINGGVLTPGGSNGETIPVNVNGTTYMVPTTVGWLEDQIVNAIESVLTAAGVAGVSFYRADGAVVALGPGLASFNSPGPYITQTSFAQARLWYDPFDPYASPSPAYWFVAAPASAVLDPDRVSIVVQPARFAPSRS